ncbi:MAG: N-acetylmuramic acid 6-phosphate etherase [Prochloraceae cyanobacterium]|nr:N-acetylmuramic acid 6-phosphate etherase [Prochloraceae cyanobacterium]
MNYLEQRSHLLTEQVNPNSENLDLLSNEEIVDLFNREDAKTIEAIAKARQPLARAIELTSVALGQGGRLFYIGAGTSGRLGVLDAAECPPTFCTPPEMVRGIIAGGEPALVKSSENLEDSSSDGAEIIVKNQVNKLDIVIGITAGGTTPFVRGALARAKELAATTVFISCVPSAQVESDADLDIRLLTGAEILAGSTRLKAGTVTKMALNIISTGAMIRLGKVYGNRMVDVAVTNQKLRDRALNIIEDLTELDRNCASQLLEKSQGSVKLALLMHWKKLDRNCASQLLEKNQNNLRIALNSNKSSHKNV